MNKAEVSESQAKEEVPSLTVLHAIGAHLQRKKVGKESFFEKDVGTQWDTGDKVALSFVQQIEAKFAKKNKLYNFFREDPSGNDLPLASHLKNLNETHDGFGRLSSFVLDSMVSSATRKAGTSLSDAYVVIIHYMTRADEGDEGRLLVVLLDKKGVFNFNRNYEPTNRDSIDIDALKQAAMIDVTLFKGLYPSRDGDAYLQFIKGNQSSDFFKESLECGDAIENAASVDAIFEALDEFSDEHGLGISVHNKIQKSIESKLSEYAKRKAPVSIDYIQGWVDECLDDGHAAKGKFAEHVNVKGHQVNEWTAPTTNSIIKAGSFVIEDDKKSYSCKVNKGTVGTYDSDKKVKLTKDTRYLMIPLSEVEREEIIKRVTEHDNDQG
ncbi:nucleoid-associated protein [Halomonas sp. H5]|uniref:nucleoid-associated protein n=1 Tax=Halomonas sp. H5 TaxID=3423910 RepID=UPI003D35C730